MEEGRAGAQIGTRGVDKTGSPIINECWNWSEKRSGREKVKKEEGGYRSLCVERTHTAKQYDGAKYV